LVIDLENTEARNDRAAEGQQQFSGPTDRKSTVSHELSFDSCKALVVRQSPAGKDASTEAEYVVAIRYQATTCEDTANLDDLELAVVRSTMRDLVGAM
jgi:hypothetical protein